MSLKLYFLRHGQAGSRQDWHGDDTQRPLTIEGKKRMQREAATIWTLELPLDVIISSPLLRAVQTAEIVAKARGSAARLVTCLGREWGLCPDERSKLERALTLVEAGPRVPRPRKGLGIDPGASMAEAARRILRDQLNRMVAHERGARDGRDTEKLHDMRVATRRMRAALRVFRPYLDPTAYKPFRRMLRRTGRSLGTARDLDVFREKAQQYLEALPDERRSELDPLLAVWQTAYGAAREEMLALLDSKAYVQFRQEFARFLAIPGAGTSPEASASAAQGYRQDRDRRGPEMARPWFGICWRRHTQSRRAILPPGGKRPSACLAPGR